MLKRIQIGRISLRHFALVCGFRKRMQGLLGARFLVLSLSLTHTTKRERCGGECNSLLRECMKRDGRGGEAKVHEKKPNKLEERSRDKPWALVY